MIPIHTKSPFAIQTYSDNSSVITAEEGRRFIAYLFRFPDGQEKTDGQLLAAAPELRAVLAKVHAFFINYVMVTYSESYAEEMTELFYEINNLLVNTPSAPDSK